MLRSSSSYFIILTVYDSRSSGSTSGFAILPLLLRISSFTLSFLLDLEVELSRRSSLGLLGVGSGLETMPESVSFKFNDDLLPYFLPVLDPRRSFSFEFDAGLFPTASFLMVCWAAMAGTTVFPMGSAGEEATLSCLEGSMELWSAPCDSS